MRLFVGFRGVTSIQPSIGVIMQSEIINDTAVHTKRNQQEQRRLFFGGD